MSKLALKLISDFNVEPFARCLRTAPHGTALSVDVYSYGQMYQALNCVAGANEPLVIVVWTLPERIIPSFSKALDFEHVEFSTCLEEVDAFADSILALSASHSSVFIMSWVMSADQKGYGLLDWRPGLGLHNLLAQMNVRLATRLGASRNIYMLNSEKWIHGSLPPSRKLWHAAKVPFANAVFEKAAYDLLAGIRAISGQSKKLVIVDLDQTIWGGVIGETGWEGIQLGGHDHVGEAFREFQEALKALTHRGIQLAIVSKNDESVALEAIDRHPEMALRRDCFAGWKINWQDKAANVAALVKELKLGLDAVVFIDDNPAERERVRSAYPEVLVPEWPSDPSSYVTALRGLACFDTAALSNEDRTRTAMYVADRERRDIKNTMESNADWLRKLETRLLVSPVATFNIARVSQLFNKTNQLNLTTRRLSEKEILAWAEHTDHTLLAVSASDRFGDMGLVGIVGMSFDSVTSHLSDFILSCRVMGRQVEESMIHLAIEEARKRGFNTLLAQYVPTPRNRPTLDVLRRLAFIENERYVFRYDIHTHTFTPDGIDIRYSDNDNARQNVSD